MCWFYTNINKKMKKGKGTMTITIGLVCFVLTYIIFMQFKTVEETNITLIETMREAELTESLASWKERYNATEEKLLQNNETLIEYRQKRASNQEATELLNKELLQAQTIAGLTDVTGDGVVITFYDKSEENKVKDRELLELINELKYAGAEAISINDQRIVNMTNIMNIWIGGEDDNESYKEDFYILIDNSKRITSPYVIKAIGDPKTLESTLTAKISGFISRYSNATLKVQNNIVIPKYNGEENFKLRYAQEVTKGEEK